jgi:hypothetical protein
LLKGIRKILKLVSPEDINNKIGICLVKPHATLSAKAITEIQEIIEKLRNSGKLEQASHLETLLQEKLPKKKKSSWKFREKKK